jgi:hypothetical protein
VGQGILYPGLKIFILSVLDINCFKSVYLLIVRYCNFLAQRGNGLDGAKKEFFLLRWEFGALLGGQNEKDHHVGFIFSFLLKN